MKHTFNVWYDKKEENNARLKMCSSHYFIHSNVYREMWECKNCGGMIPSEFYVWWIDGMKAGRKIEKRWQNGRYAEVHEKLRDIVGDLDYWTSDQWPEKE